MNEKGKALRASRKQKGLSALELSKATGVTQAYISALELGKRNGSADVWEKLASFLENPRLLIMHIDDGLDSLRENSLYKLAKAIISISHALDLSWNEITERSNFELGKDYFIKLQELLEKKDAGCEMESITQFIDEPIVDELIEVLGKFALAIKSKEAVGESDFQKTRIILPLFNDVSPFASEIGSSYENFASEYLSVPISALKGDNFPSRPFLFKVEGNNMSGTGIEDGSLVLVNPNNEIRNGDIALIEWKGIISVNYLLFNSDGHIEIRSANKDLHPVRTENRDLRIFGQITKIYSEKDPEKVL